MSTRYIVPTPFAEIAVGRPFATHFDGTPSHVKVGDDAAARVARDGTVGAAFLAPLAVFGPELRGHRYDVVVVDAAGRARVTDVDATSHEEALNRADEFVAMMFAGRGPAPVSATIIDREEQDVAFGVRVVDLRVVRPHACDENCVGCATCYAATGTTRCSAVCVHAAASLVGELPRVPASVEFHAREQAGRAGLSRRYDVVKATTHDDGTTTERVVEGGFFALSAADDAAAEYQRDHDRELRRRASALTTGGAR